MLVGERFMQMLVLVRFGEMQINADSHERLRADHDLAGAQPLDRRTELARKIVFGCDGASTLFLKLC